MTDKSELERVRVIHSNAAYLLKYIGEYREEDVFTLDDNGVTWTREELLAWPERLEAIRRRLAAAFCGDGASWTDSGYAQLFTAAYFAEGCDLASKPYVERGLCLYSEMLTDEQPAAVEQVAKAWEPMVVQRIVEAIQRAQKPVDPYEQHRLKEETEVARRMQALSWESSLNAASRARNIAALRAELDRPLSIAEQQHPREWFSGRRGGRRKL